MNLYEWMYTYLTPWTKRPWTYFTRDVWHNVEYLCIMICLFIGFYTGYYWAKYDVCLWWLTILWANATIWFIMGHILWGTVYKSGQRGK